MAENKPNSGREGKLVVRLVTPDRLLVDDTADAVELPSTSGYLEALYGHAPLLAELGAGEVRLHGSSSGDQTFFVAWGFVEVLPERVTILAEEALRPGEIDRNEAEGELKRAMRCGRAQATTGTNTMKPTRWLARPRKRSPLLKVKARDAYSRVKHKSPARAGLLCCWRCVTVRGGVLLRRLAACLLPATPGVQPVSCAL